MNMISTGAFQTEMDSSIEQETLAKVRACLGKEKILRQLRQAAFH